MEPTIVIDAGHGGYDNGATYNGRREKDDNLRLALAVGRRLEQMGYPVVYTRTTDVYQRPIEKAQISNESGGDYFVSFHRNSSTNANQYSGAQTLVYNDSGVVSQLARSVNEGMAQAGFTDLGVDERKDLVVLRRTTKPAILIEAGFLNSDTDNAIFDQNFDALVTGIAEGIANAVGTKPEMVKQYGVQTGLFRRYENAQYQQSQLLEQGFAADITDWNGYYAVVVGRENNLEGARALEQQLRTLGYDTLIVNR